ncbi:MAG: hypothetical protein M3066_02870 [Actinomycetota bacterium]|nr:hypothetical protein [Actinomycetota bacterium]
MALIYVIVSIIITGAIFGALGRLAIPGPNPMSIGMTILVGIGGAFLGGVVGALIGAGAAIVFILEVLGAALIVYLMQRRGAGSRI